MDYLQSKVLGIQIFTAHTQDILGKTCLSDQSSNIRVFLRIIMADLELHDELDDTKHPYQLKGSKIFLSFTHSCSILTIAMTDKNSTKNIGIDTEKRPITQKVAQRFFAQAELNFLTNLGLQQQEKLKSALWMAKEAHIKVTQIDLIKGLGVDMTEFFELSSLLVSLNKKQPVVLSAQKNKIQFVWLPKHNAMLCIEQ